MSFDETISCSEVRGELTRVNIFEDFDNATKIKVPEEEMDVEENQRISGAQMCITEFGYGPNGPYPLTPKSLTSPPSSNGNNNFANVINNPGSNDYGTNGLLSNHLPIIDPSCYDFASHNFVTNHLASNNGSTYNVASNYFGVDQVLQSIQHLPSTTWIPTTIVHDVPIDESKEQGQQQQQQQQEQQQGQEQQQLQEQQPIVARADARVPSTSQQLNGPSLSSSKRRGSSPLPGRHGKRIRTAYTSLQLVKMEAEFAASSYLTRTKRIQMAEQLELSERQIKIWFQNRRMKLKKETIVLNGGRPPSKDSKKKSRNGATPLKRSASTAATTSLETPPQSSDEENLNGSEDSIIEVAVIRKNQPTSASNLVAPVLQEPETINVCGASPEPRFDFEADYLPALNFWSMSQHSDQFAETQVQLVQRPMYQAQSFDYSCEYENAALYNEPENNCFQPSAIGQLPEIYRYSATSNSQSFAEANDQADSCTLPVLYDLSAWLGPNTDEAEANSGTLDYMDL